jgi:D-alanyl-D-alanine carboxypeptidase (penicillin-binding protein 5/6)
MLLASASAWGQAVPAESVRNAPGLEARLKPLIDAHEGTVAVAVRHLESGQGFGYRDAEPMPTASLIKVAVMVEAYRQAEAGSVDLSEPVVLDEDDKVQGSGILTTHFSAGTRMPLRDAIRLMIAYSDNTATNLVLDEIGLRSPSETMEELGLPNTKIHAKVYRADTSVFPDRSKQFGLGSTTAAETVRLLTMLHAGRLAGKESTAEMIGHLRACQDESLGRLLPAGTKVAHKTGWVGGIRTAAGIIDSPAGPFAVCVLTSDNKDRRSGDENAARLLCGTIAKAAYDHFNSPRPSDVAASPGELREGASGWLVEALQRALNRKLSPSPGLATDGEFGPATRDAVVKLQKEHDLEPSGIVNKETWAALGPISAGDGAAAPLRELESIDALAGPPFVTCKAWAVADASDGRFLWGSRETEKLDIASTTKLMTAHVVLQLAEKEPQVLDEIVTFSRRADSTGGSTADVREGEKVSVGELLYGLMLPSGNDASTALAEHFGARFEPAEVAVGSNGDGSADGDTEDAVDPHDRFVAEMNREAARLGMADTHYENPHGLTARGHRSTARDLTKLAAAASRSERLMKYVGTRRHVSRLEGPGGYTREIVWENTNHLLGIDGYAGMKTGTTSAAGACLISLGRREKDGLIVVVLGATSSDARYTDTRNLYRWAWLQRGHAAAQSSPVTP